MFLWLMALGVFLFFSQWIFLVPEKLEIRLLGVKLGEQKNKEISLF